MRRERVGTLFDAALVQLGWWACVLGAARGYFLLGPAVVAALLVLQTWGLPNAARRQVWRDIVCLGTAGTAIDSLQGGFGVLDFRGGSAGWLGGALAPLWITALWCQFATILPAFAPLRSRPIVAGLLGAVGGPLAYAGGARVGAAGLHPEAWISLLIVAAVWAVAFPAMLRLLVAAPEGETTMHNTGRNSALVAVLFLFYAAPTTVYGSDDSGGTGIAPGSSQKILLDERAGRFRRSFRLHVPGPLPGDGPRPLVLAIHGGFATGRILEQQTGLSEIADRHGFFVAYPNGLGIGSLLRHWNGGYCCGKALATELDDLGFLDRVIEWVLARYAIDHQRLYVIGYSNGGMIAYRYAAERAERLAGLGIWASSIGSLEGPVLTWTLPEPAGPLPALIAHGGNDRRLPFDTSAARGGQRLLGAMGSASAWAESNGCQDAPSISRSREGAVEHRIWCAAGASPVALVRVEDWGHDWPGPKRTGQLPASHPLRGFHLAEEMWNFFRRHGSAPSGSSTPWLTIQPNTTPSSGYPSAVND